MRGEKRAMAKNIYSGVTVKKFDELSGELALKNCLGDENCRRYIPEEWSKPKAKYSRGFCWSILASEYPDYTSQVLNNAEKIRDPTQFSKEEEMPL